MATRFLLLIILISFSSLSGQNLNELLNKKVSPLFLSQIYKENSFLLPSKPGGELIAPAPLAYNENTKIFSAVIRLDTILTGSLENYDLNSVAPGFATARLTHNEILNLVENENILYIYPGEVLYPNNDIARGLTGAALVNDGYVEGIPYDGSDVIVLVIDTGIDWTHMDFRDLSDTTQSRILYLWDQTLTTQGSETTPEDRNPAAFSGLDYGAEYTTAQINDEIDGSPAGFVRERDYNGHGTHVAGSAAGNGGAAPAGKYKGMAPAADIVFVKAGNGSFPTANILDAIDYATGIAQTENKPVVINMSLGGHANAHDGTRDMDIAVDNFTTSGSGRIAVVAAGNEGNDQIHTSGTLNSGGTASVSLTVPTYNSISGSGNDFFGFDLWLSDAGSVTAKVTTPSGYTHTVNANNSATKQTNDGTIYLFNAVDASHTNGDRRIYLNVYDNDANYVPKTGTWTLELTSNVAYPMEYHGWLFSESMDVTLVGGNTSYTVGSPGTSTNAITVGAYVSRLQWENYQGYVVTTNTAQDVSDIASFSSKGPRRDDVLKPDITAPGQTVISSTASTIIPYYLSRIEGLQYHTNQGTSMASPVTAGCVALLLDYDPSMTAARAKELLTGYAITDSYTGSVPNTTWGYGKTDILSALVKAVNSSWPAFTQILAYDEWTNNQDSVSFTSSEKIAVRVSPSVNGELSGLYVYPAVIFDETGTLTVEVYNENNGSPGNATGVPLTYDMDELLGTSWNYINLSSAGVNVSSGNNYYIVLSHNSASSMNYITETVSPDNRSLIYSSGTWNSYGSGDLRLRGVVTPAQSALPVELVSFSARVHKGKVILNWQTATEVNNYGFEIERSPVSEDKESFPQWSKKGFVKGKGTSNTTHSYTYIDDVISGSPGSMYRLKQVDNDGLFMYSNVIEVNTGNVNVFRLGQNYPNPFNPVTLIGFNIPERSDVRLIVYNSLGQKVKELIDGKLDAGVYKRYFSSEGLASGVYYYTLEAGSYSDTRKMLLLK